MKKKDKSFLESLTENMAPIKRGSDGVNVCNEWDWRKEAASNAAWANQYVSKEKAERSAWSDKNKSDYADFSKKTNLTQSPSLAPTQSPYSTTVTPNQFLHELPKSMEKISDLTKKINNSSGSDQDTKAVIDSLSDLSKRAGSNGMLPTFQKYVDDAKSKNIEYKKSNNFFS